MNIYEWPAEWYGVISGRFHLRAAAITSRSVFTPRRNNRLSYQVWMADFVLKPERGPSSWQGKDAFFARLDGEVGGIRLGDPLRCKPARNRPRSAGTGSPWSDGTGWSDGTEWADDLIPPTAEIDAAVTRGDSTLVVRGLPVSMFSALAPGDLFEIRPNGVPTETSNLYEIVVGGATDADGKLGIEFRPRLRQNFAVGDMIVFRNPRGVFRLADGDQAMLERSGNVGNLGFSVIEHVG